MGTISYIIEVSVAWTILYGLFFAFLRKETFFDINRWYLLSSFLFGLTLPFLKHLAIEWLFISNDESVQYTITQIQQLPQFVATSIQPEESWKDLITNALFSIYLAGAIVIFGKFLHGLHSIYTLYKSGIKTKKAEYTLVQNEEYHLPFSFFDMVFLSNSAPLNEEVDHIIRHELKHVESRHTLDVLLIEIIQIFFWFHPMVYLYKSALRQTHEYIADQAVVGSGSRRAYSHLLVKQAMPGIQLALSHQFFQSHIKKRIDMMYQSKSTKMALIKYSVAIPVLALLIIVFSSQREAIAADSIDPIEESELLEFVADYDETQTVDADDIRTNLPTYKEGDKALLMFLSKNITYPAYARKNGIQGQIQVTFSIDEQGYVGGISINKEIGGGCGQAAAEVINKMNMNGPSWTPALTNGKAVSTELVLPVIFKLESEDGERIAEMETKKYKLPSNSLETLTVTGYAPKKALAEGYKSQTLSSPSIDLTDGEISKVVKELPTLLKEDIIQKIENIQANSPEIRTGIFNIPPNSLIVQAGNEKLQEGKDYEVDYQLGVIRILSKEYLQKKEAITVSFDTDNETKSSSAVQDTSKNPLVIIDGNISRLELSKATEFIKPADIMSVTVLKDKKAETAYPGWGERGVIEIVTKNPMKTKESLDDKENPIYIIDGEAFLDKSESKIEELDPESIKTINVYKGDSAVSMHPEAGKRGVVEIITKSPEDSQKNTINTKKNVSSKQISSSNPIFIIDGEIYIDRSEGSLKELNPDDIKTINVYKDEAAEKLYPNSSERGIIKITTKHPKKTKKILDDKKSQASISLSGKAVSTTNPIYIIDGETYLDKSESYIEELESDDIATINVYKGKAADKLHPNSGERGIIEIITKNPQKSRKELLENNDNKAQKDVIVTGYANLNKSDSKDQESKSEIFKAMPDNKVLDKENQTSKHDKEAVVEINEVALELDQNIPNPWKDVTTVSFQLPSPASATVRVFDMTGRVSYEYTDDFSAGDNSVTIRKDDLGTSGIYYYEVRSGAYSQTRKMQLID